jgi:RNA ligase (TIGR02306 family)
MSSEAKVEVVRIGEIEPHGNADSLGVVMVHGGYPVCVRLTDWSPGMLAAYLPVDSVVDTSRPEFAFLDKPRIRAKRLRGVFSMGLLVVAPEGAREGDDVTEALGVTHWTPEEEPQRGVKNAGDDDPGPSGWAFPLYTDIEPIRRHRNVLRVGEDVVVTEKIHGANARFAHDGERLWVGSRTRIKRHDDGNTWWRVAKELDLYTHLQQLPRHVFFGEVFGKIQDLDYGINGVSLRIFDVFDGNRGVYLNHDNGRAIAAAVGLPWVPILYRGPWDPARVNEWAEGASVLASGGHVRAGFVVKPTTERVEHMGRVILKMHGEGYLTRKERK